MDSFAALASNSTCASGILLGFNKSSSNVTEVFSQLAECPRFCEDAFETGDLDFVGRGIQIATIIQSGLTFLVSGIFPILVYFTRTLPIRPLVSRLPLLRDFKHKVQNIHLFFALCLMTSIIFQIARASRPVLETAFLSSFIRFESSISSTLYWGGIIDDNINSIPLAGIDFLCIAVVCALWVLGSKVSVPDPKFYRMLANSCRTQSTVAAGLTHSTDDNVTTAQGLDIKPNFGAEGSAREVLLWILPIFFVIAVTIALLFRFKNKLPGWLRRHGKAVGWGFFLVIHSFSIFFNIWGLQNDAQLVQMMRKKELPPQNDWDFGQITALMIWLPAALELLTLMRKWRNPLNVGAQKQVGVGTEKAPPTSVTGERQPEFGSDNCGQSTAKTLIPVEYELPRTEKAPLPPPYRQPSEAISGHETLPQYEPPVSDTPQATCSIT